jgi:hypothetical protein
MITEKIKFDKDKSLNGVNLSFSSQSNAGIMPVLLFFLTKLIRTRMEDPNERGKLYTLFSLHISSTSEPYYKHKEGGPHRRGLAIDIAAINGKSITTYYGVDSDVTGICNSLQYNAIYYPEVFENFGPMICFKTKPNGVITQIEKDKDLINAHKTHIHFSVRG